MTHDDRPAAYFQEAIDAMQPAIDKLLFHYQQFGLKGFEVNTSHLPEKQIQQFLSNIDINYPSSSQKRLRLAIRSFLSELDCFRYHIIAKDKNNNKNIAIWNPLEQEYKTFCAKYSNHNIICRDTSYSYPSVDIISDWISDQLEHNIYLDQLYN